MSARFERVHPLKETKNGPRPFPTLYWLTDPALLRAVSDLERLGAIAGFIERVGTDSGFRSSVAADHARYAAERWGLLDDAARIVVAESGFAVALRDRGVGGAATPRPSSACTRTRRTRWRAGPRAGPRTSSGRRCWSGAAAESADRGRKRVPGPTVRGIRRR